MSYKNILYALTKVNEWMQSPSGRAANPPQELSDMVATALADGMAGLQNMGRKANPDGTRSTGGRPPSVRYMIEVSNMAPRVVLGTAAAIEAVNEVMAEHKETFRMTSANMSVGIARNGSWWRNIETSNGTITVAVSKAKEQAK